MTKTIFFALSILFFSCEDSSPTEPDGGDTGGDIDCTDDSFTVNTIPINITSSSFPDNTSISQCDIVIWTNNSGFPHDVTSESGSELGSATLNGSGGSYEHQFENQGSFDYFCTIHGSGMSGTITVE